jgi:ATP phosphoribosyltransferase regulatory subunit
MKISAALPTGVAALLFDAARRRRELESRIVGELEEAGYGEVILPILDYLEPYRSLLPASSRNELYRFVDRDGEMIALRADFTPMLARLLAPRLGSLELPLRFFYRGDVVRYHEEQAGRMREFYQVGAELLGADEETADREMLTLFLRFLCFTPSRPLRVVMGFAGALDDLLLDAVGADQAAELVHAVEQRSRSAAARGDVLRQVVELGEPADPAALGAAAAPRLRRLLALRDELRRRFPQVRLSVDLAEFASYTLHPELRPLRGDRGYYDGLMFRGYAGARGVPVGAGGRYDELFGELGTPVPAIGFALGLERLMNGHLAADGRPRAGEAP